MIIRAFESCSKACFVSLRSQKYRAAERVAGPEPGRKTENRTATVDSTSDRAGLAEIACGNSVAEGELISFHPRAIEARALPDAAPTGIAAEFREAERCIASEAWRAASALFRSALGKTMRANGYLEGSLKARIDEAVKDTVITGSRARKAHEDVAC